MSALLETLRAFGPVTQATLLCITALALWSLLSVAARFWRLRKIPGPTLAAFSDLPRVAWVFPGKVHEKHRDLHTQYGDFVRFGPNMVSISNPAAIPTVYPMRRGTVKSPFYSVLLPYTGGKGMPVMIATPDEDIHKMLKSPVAPIFSHTNTLSFEKYVDRTIGVFLEQLEKRFGHGEVCDLGEWLQMLSFDTIGELTFSRRYGLLEHGGDIDNYMEKVWTHFKTAAPVTQMPWIDKYINKNAVAAYLRPPTSSPLMAITVQRIQERIRAENTLDDAEKAQLNDRDFLSRFMDAQRNDPSVPPWAVNAWAFSNVTAGSDSSAVVMRTFVYNLLTHPDSMKTLMSELQSANLSEIAAWKEVRDLPYLDACVKEALRMHPPFALPFERVIPEGGVVIMDQFIPGGTCVGMNPWVVNRHKPTFGDDAEEWNPSRWLVDEPKRRSMEAAMLTFGAGRRICLGTHVAYLIIKKAVPSLLMAFDMDLVDPSTWKVENYWFFLQTGMIAAIRKREVGAKAG